MDEQPKHFNIADLFFQAAKKHSDKPAIIYKRQQVSFGQLERQVNQTSQYFIKKGITKGDRVLVFVPMSIKLYRTVLALFNIGATAVFLDEWVNKSRLDECCKVAQCKAFVGIFKARVLAKFSNELSKIPVKLSTAYHKNNPEAVIPITGKDDVALITFTTGTTGTPKAALRTHGFLYNQFMALEKEIAPSVDDVSMPVLPIVLLINLGTGTTSVIAKFKGGKPNSLRPKRIVKAIKKHGVNTVIASPFFVKKISTYLIYKRVVLPQMRKIFTGGAPVFPTEAALYDEAFPHTKTTVVYGSTEAEPICTLDIKKLLLHQDSILNGLNVGQPAECASISIIQITDGDITINSEAELAAIMVRANVVGEIIVSGNHVLRQYLNNAAALRRNKIFVAGKCWHRTGDSGYIDETGDLFLMGRCNQVIQNASGIIYPFVHESYLQTIDGVEIGTVVMHGGQITAIIQPSNHSLKAKVETTIKTQSPQIEQVIFVKNIPRDPRHNSKIDYQKLAVDFGA